MKKIYKLVTLLMILGLFTACSSSDDDNNATITISKTEYTVGAEKDSEAVATFSTNVNWTTSKISYVGDSKDWLTATSSGKAGVDQTITMKAAGNTTGIDRKASFDINYGGKRQKLTVTQLGENVEPKITISTSEFTVSGEQDSEAVATFSVNVDWTTSAINYVGDTKDWLTVTPEGKAGTDQTITMKAVENSAGIERTASFNINYGGKEHKLTVNQKIKENSDITAHFDAKFAAKLQEKGYISDATKILFSEVKNITTINIEETEVEGEITSLSGIEYFEALTDLNFGFHKVSALDLSKNVALTSLICPFNELSTLDLSKNVALNHLDCSYNQLAALGLSENIALTYLDCQKNLLPSLNVSMNTALDHFDFQRNQITAIDLSKNIALTYLACQNNKLPSLDVSTNTALKTFLCASNKLTVLDVSKNTKIENLNCFDNELTTLNLGNNTALIVLLCLGNNLSSLDVSGTTNLVHLFCNANQLTSLDITKNPVLAKLTCSRNKLSILDLSKNPNLTQLFCYENNLTTLDVSKNQNLIGLDLTGNPGAGTTFVVKSWFDNSSIPSNFTKDPWVFNGTTITPDYQKVN